MVKQSSSISKLISLPVLTSFVSMAFTFLIATGCGGPGKIREGTNNSCVPSALKYVPRDNGVLFQWRPNCGASGAARGYNFYIVPDSELTQPQSVD